MAQPRLGLFFLSSDSIETSFLLSRKSSKGDFLCVVSFYLNLKWKGFFYNFINSYLYIDNLYFNFDCFKGNDSLKTLIKCKYPIPFWTYQSKRWSSLGFHNFFSQAWVTILFWQLSRYIKKNNMVMYGRVISFNVIISCCQLVHFIVLKFVQKFMFPAIYITVLCTLNFDLSSCESEMHWSSNFPTGKLLYPRENLEIH